MTEKQTYPLDAAALTFSLLGNLVYQEPAEELTRELLSPGFFEEIPFRGTDERVKQGILLLENWALDQRGRELSEVCSELNSEHLRLLVGYGTPAAPPWMSYYFEKDPLVFGKKTLEVRAWFARYGLESKRKYHEPDDHLGLMLQFLAAIIEQEDEAVERGNEDAAQDCRKDESVFMRENLLPWVDHWQGLVDKESKNDFYRGLALLIAGTVQSYACRF